MDILRALVPLFLILPTVAFAQVPSRVPSAADVGRVDMNKPDLTQSLQKKKASIYAPDVVMTEAPAGAKNIRFVLNDVQVDGVSVFTKEELDSIFVSRKNTKISLNMVWDFAAELTQLYRAHGYFLSRVYVPAQDIDGGVVVLKAVEGYIGKVVVDDPSGESYVADMATRDLLSEKPIRVETVESYLIRLNDLPGVEYRAVLSEADTDIGEGAVQLSLKPSEEPDAGLIRFDNYASRYLGPNQVYGYYETSFIPLHKTGLSILSSIPADELKNVGLTHNITLTPSLTLELGGSVTNAQPGYRLKQFDLKSRSVSWEGAFSYKPIRQRDENLTFRIAFGGRNTTSDLAGAAYTRDRIVALRAALAYDLVDSWSGQNILNATLSRGIDGLGASDENDSFLSRARAKPDFTKLEVGATRVQALPKNLIARASVSGQVASGGLYSSEEYGYGGQVFGRAYDSSELTGDEGISASLELQYNGFRNPGPLGISPFIFYDIGKIWNEDPGQKKRESAASAGFGLRFDTFYDISGEVGAAFPLTRSIDAPLYGGNGENPRIIMQISKRF